MEVTLVRRVWFVLIFTTVFLILCVVQLERRKKWLWHLVFIPLWILDAVTITSLIIWVILHSPHPEFNVGLRRKLWLLYLIILKLAFLLALCAKLDGLTKAPYSQIFIPLWFLLFSIGADAIVATVRSARNEDRRQ